MFIIKKNHRRFKIFAWLKKRGKITLFFLSETCECNTEGKITGRSDVASHYAGPRFTKKRVKKKTVKKAKGI